MIALRRHLAVLAVAALAAAATLQARGVVAQDAPAKGLEGAWKLVVLQYGEDEFAIVKLDAKEGKLSGKVSGSQNRLFGEASSLKVDPLAVEGDSVTLGLTGPAGVNIFRGKLVKEGRDAGRVLGSFTFRGEPYPARLERTTAESVGEMKRGEIVQSYAAIAQDRDPKSKIKKAREIIEKNPGNPALHLIYGDLLSAAEAGGMTAAEVAAIVDRWSREAEPYGGDWLNAVRLKALKALNGAGPYADQAVKLAEGAERALGVGGSVESRAAVVGMLARAARLAGKTELAEATSARAAKLEAELDEEYHKKVPPFTPTKYEGRKNSKADRVVLMELFTGAQCPPCVAADVGFDALLKTYAPTELIGLQYHLHIPGPDPMTNEASQGRQEYYGDAIRGTPSTFFNGASKAGGGGFMQHSEGKYAEYREVVDKQLEDNREAAITLTAALNGDEIDIQAQATVDRKSPVAKQEGPDEEARPEGGKKESGGSGHSRPRLRLALTEEAVRYVGGNRLRFHHHVVRAFPGGVDGKELSSGSGNVSLKLNLADLRRELREKNAADAKRRPFPNALPEIELKDLSVVAFVQDDADKAVLHAVSVPVR